MLPKNVTENAGRFAWRLHDDGSFDCGHRAGGQDLLLSGAYPAVDNVPLRAVSVRVTPSGDGGTIFYTALNLTLLLRFAVDDAGVATLDTLVACDPSHTPDSVAPLSGMKVAHAVEGFTAESGFVAIGKTKRETPETVDSSLCIALIADNGTTIVVSPDDHSRFGCRMALDTKHATVRAGFALERVAIPGRGEITLPTIRFSSGANPEDALRGAASATGRTMNARALRESPFPTSYHWCSWYYEFQHLTETRLGEYLRGFVEQRATLTAVQLDVGYSASIGDWLEKSHRYPSGLKAAFDQISAAGYNPGIWIAPFMVGSRSKLATLHPDWLLQDHSGNPVNPWNMKYYGEERLWGYQDEEYYMLDTSHPQAFAYLRDVFRTMHGWGARFFKTDFMHWGIQSSASFKRHTPGKTSVEYFRDLLSMIREEIGEESYWLGCIAPFAPFIGYADGMRVGADVGPAWDGGGGAVGMLCPSRNTQFFNQIFWQNDPDSVLLRDFHIYLSEREVVSLALWQGMLGGVVCTSDPLHEIPENRRALWSFIRPVAGVPVASVRFVDETGCRAHAIDERFAFLCRDTNETDSGGKTLLILNATPTRRTEVLNLDALVRGRIVSAVLCNPVTTENRGVNGDFTRSTWTLEPHESVLLRFVIEETEAKIVIERTCVSS